MLYIHNELVGYLVCIWSASRIKCKINDAVHKIEYYIWLQSISSCVYAMWLLFFSSKKKRFAINMTNETSASFLRIFKLMRNIWIHQNEWLNETKLHLWIKKCFDEAGTELAWKDVSYYAIALGICSALFVKFTVRMCKSQKIKRKRTSLHFAPHQNKCADIFGFKWKLSNQTSFLRTTTKTKNG